MQLQLYYREECHLCDAMRKALVIFNREKYPINWSEIDIDRDQDLILQYDSKVPVLCLAGQEICHYFFDQSALLKALN